MPLYMIQYSYTAEAWEALVTGKAGGKPVQRDRQAAVEDLVKALGGKFPRLVFAGGKPADIQCKKFAFGEHDVVALVHFPSNKEAAAFAMMISATGSVKSFKTTPLMALEEAIRAMELAGETRAKVKTYAPPHRPTR